MTALADLISDRDRQRLLERVREPGELDGLMRQRGTLAGPDEPVPLHRAGRDITNSFIKSSTERTTP